MNDDKTCAPNYEAICRQLQEELERAKREIEALRAKHEELWLKEQEFDTVLRTLELIFGRKFYND